MEGLDREVTLIAVSQVAVEFGATRIFEDITFTVGSGDRWGIVGRNGTGKTTLFSLITGERRPTRGQVSRQPNVRVSLLEQHREFHGATTLWEVAAGPFAELMRLEASLAEQAVALAEDSSEAAMDRYARDLERFEREGGYTYAPRVDAVLHGLGFDPEQARTRKVQELSGGERGRLGLVRQLVSPADILLLDEPTNHLDLETSAWLEQYLRTASQTFLIISHDRAFLAAVTDHMLHFEGGTASAYTGGYEAFVQQREERRLTQLRQFDKQQKVIAAEKDYIARNIAGQNSAQAKGRRKRLERMPRLSAPIGEDGVMALRFESGGRGGDQVVVTEKLRVGVGDRVLLEEFSNRVIRGDRIGLIGPNGAGKSTLLKTIVGEREPQAGVARVGGGISVAYYRQDLAQVPLDKTLYDIIQDLRPAWERRLIQGHLGRFGFSGDEAQRRPETLSGGERARVALAMLVLSQPNLLVLDEPTNHLDVESIEALEDAIENYEGTIVLVSHDRALLRSVVDRVWVLDHARITDYDGSFTEWEDVSKERAHAASVRAAEEESLRRVKEKQKMTRKDTAPSGDRDTRNELRKLTREIESLEAAIAQHEAAVGRLTATLEDPSLYTRPGGVAESVTIGKSLEEARAKLDDAMARWTEAVERKEKIT
ncbi:MAG TPA: ABC-F family ATP-binding cassette domain-containing protein [Gemmatimonadaceae bacterium]|nr:ABC-F family ATP-binding cassette domain-containing protein [Gemmatimonadaceae bacterium]